MKYRHLLIGLVAMPVIAAAQTPTKGQPPPPTPPALPITTSRTQIPAGASIVPAVPPLQPRPTLPAPVVTVPVQQVPQVTRQPYNGNELLAECNEFETAKGEKAWLAGGHCLGFVGAILDGIHFTESELGKSIICAPTEGEGFAPGQAVPVVQKYLRDHPDTLHLPAAALVGSALEEAFPCQSTKRR